MGLRAPLAPRLGAALIALAIPYANAARSATPASTAREPDTTNDEIADLWTEALVERYAFDDGNVVVSEWPGNPTVAVCVAATTRRSDLSSERRWLDEQHVERRGGVLQESSVGSRGVWCVTLPSAEAAFGLWLAERFARGQAFERKDASEADLNTVASETRMAALALEGSVFSEGARPPGNVIAVSGGVAADDVKRLVEELARKPLRDADVSRTTLVAHQSSERLSVLETPLPSPRAKYGWLVDGDADRRAALRVATEILAGGPASRLRRDLIVRRFLAHSVDAFSSVVSGGAIVGIEVEISTRTTLDRTRRFIDGAIKQLRLVGPSHGELRRAKNVLQRAALVDWENPTDRARHLALYELAHGDARAWLDELRALGPLTEEAVRKAAHDGLVDARRSTVEMYPPQWPEDDPKLAHYRAYTVEPADSISELAARFGVTDESIARANDLDPRFRLVPGQVLFIPPNP